MYLKVPSSAGAPKGTGDAECGAATMTTIRPFEPEDLFHVNSVNLDPFTETVTRASEHVVRHALA